MSGTLTIVGQQITVQLGDGNTARIGTIVRQTNAPRAPEYTWKVTAISQQAPPIGSPAGPNNGIILKGYSNTKRQASPSALEIPPTD